MAIKHKVAGALALTALISSATLIAPTQASAESYPVTPTGITAIDTTSTGYTLGVNYNQSAYYGTWMTQLKNVRAAAWDANLPFKDYNGATTVREAAALAGLTTRDAYINAITFDAGLEVEALIRASEVMLNPSHTRPAGLPDTIIGSGTRGENLTRNIPLDKAVGAWSTDATYGNELVNGKRISEWDSLLRSSGEWNYYNGHLYAILNPQFNTVAVGAVTNVNQATPAVVMRLAEGPTGYGATPTNATGAYRVPIAISNPGGLLHQVRLIGSSTLNISDTREVRLSTTHVTGAVQFFDVKPIGSWVSSNPAVIAVDEDGTLTAVGAGTATISYVTEAGTTYSSQALTVAAPAPIKPEPTAEPTTEPVVPEPTVEPTAAPSTEPTAIPTVEPTIEPVEPEPTVAPTDTPVEPVVPEPTEEPVDPVPSSPAEPEPTASAEPTDAPVNPVVPEPTEEPVAPQPTDAPVDPEPTAEPETPADPTDPVDPAPSTPAEPSEPTEPVIPDTEEPIQPSEPEVPAPAEPVAPEAPATESAAPVAPGQAPADTDAAPAAPEATEAATQPSVSTAPEATAEATSQQQDGSQEAQKQTAPASEDQLAHTGLTSTALLWIGLALMATGALALIRPWRAARRL